ncbi:MAG: type II secretion system protein [Thalassotalea sp.]|nr:type II secretion system protein [Thalassotalea sp.]MDG2393333.1 type II secretion system protein [Thalassotalea sp.]
MRKSTIEGFTLIKLVVVVALLGLLIVTLIPRVIHLTEKAQQVNIESTANDFANAILLAQSQWIAEGRPHDGTHNLVDYNGHDLILTAEDKPNKVRAGYPIALAPNDDILSVNDCVDIWNNILQLPPRLTSNIDDLNGPDSDSYKYFVSLQGTRPSYFCVYFLKETLNRVSEVYATPVDINVGLNFTYQPAIGSVEMTINKR